MIRVLLSCALSLAATSSALAQSLNELRYGIIVAEDHRLPSDPIFAQTLSHPSPELRAQAALALGRIGDAASVPSLVPLLADPAPRVRANGAFALGLVGGADAVTELQARLKDEEQADVRRELWMALGRAGDATVAATIAGGLQETNSLVRAGAAQALGVLFLKITDVITLDTAAVQRLARLAQSRNNTEATAAAFGLARYRASLSAAEASAATAAFQAAQAAQAKALLARVLAKAQTPSARAALLGVSTRDALGVRVETARALSAYPATTETLTALSIATQSGQAQLVVQALQGLARLATAAQPVEARIRVLATTAPSPWERGAALEAYAVVNPAAARPIIEDALGGRAADAPAALRALGTYRDESALRTIVPYLNTAHRAAAAEAVLPFDDALLTSVAKPALLTLLSTPDVAVTATTAEIAARAGWRDFATPLQSAYASFTRPDDVEVKVALLKAVGTLGDLSHAAFLESKVQESDRVVALAAAEAYQQITGTDIRSRVPGATRVVAVTPPLAELTAATRAAVSLSTTKGRVVLRMTQDAPLVAHNFVRLVRSGYYNGLKFHRVVPNFVVQGGDPRGDGYGGPGYLIRDAFSRSRHDRGTVGMASAGKDTAGSQFFVNHAPNLHLDGNYTIFAEVVSGMDVVDRIEVGDVIRAATVAP